jgi:hypothetical protein
MNLLYISTKYIFNILRRILTITNDINKMYKYLLN